MSDGMTGRIGSGLADLVRGLLGQSEESARAYLRQAWLSNAMASLRLARYHAGLTQEEIARRMGTSQPAVARLEADFEGRTTLHRFIDYALACGLIPLDLTLEPFSSVREYSLANPAAARQQITYMIWLREMASGNAAATAFETEQVAAATAFETEQVAGGDSLRDDMGMDFESYCQALQGGQVATTAAPVRPSESNKTAQVAPAGAPSGGQLAA